VKKALLKLNTPYPAIDAPVRQLLRAFLFGGFVFLFLLAFQPFGLSTLPAGILRVSAGYGLITTVVMLSLNVIIPIAFRDFFVESKWTIGNEIFWTLLNLIVIASVNLWYTHLQGFINLSLYGFFVFTFYTIAVGIFPITGLILYRASRLYRNFTSASQAISSRLQQNDPVRIPITTITEDFFQQKDKDPRKDYVFIQGEGEREEIQFQRDKLLFLKSSGNYVEIYFLDGEVQSRRVIRATLKSIASRFVGHPEFFRCHKQYLVNLKQVKHVSGNAQGLKLHLKGSETKIPVSRTLTTKVREKIDRL